MTCGRLVVMVGLAFADRPRWTPTDPLPEGAGPSVRSGALFQVGV